VPIRLAACGALGNSSPSIRTILLGIEGQPALADIGNGAVLSGWRADKVPASMRLVSGFRFERLVFVSNAEIARHQLVTGGARRRVGQ
jgi:hypothetical protein